MGYTEEFQTITLLEESQAEARAVDAFALALIKSERQIRKLFTFLIFQNPAFDSRSVPDLRNTLAKREKINFDGFLRGVDAVSPFTVAQLLGADYSTLHRSHAEATDLRNRFFCGQVTAKALSREDLFGYVHQIRAWCQHLADSATMKFGYDGFGRSSYRKASNPIRLRIAISSIADYDVFLGRFVSR